MKFISHAAGLLMLTALAACESFPAQYTPTSNLTSQTGASIVGSTILSHSLFNPNTVARLSAVDNQTVSKGWQVPVLVTPGTHILTIQISERGSLAAADVFGCATLLGDFKTGGNYTIHTTVPTGGLGWMQHFSTVWIEDNAGTPITPENKFEIDQGNPPIMRLFQN